MPLLLDEHRSEVEAQVATASSLVFYLDFDGTLAPIVAEPELARMAPDTRAILEELSSQEGVLVCVLSGRSLADIKRREWGFPNWSIAETTAWRSRANRYGSCIPRPAAARAAIEDLNRRLAGLPLLIPGVQLEPKGLTTTIHFRRAEPAARDQIEYDRAFRLSRPITPT